jgi:hypothetical protein
MSEVAAPDFFLSTGTSVRPRTGSARNTRLALPRAVEHLDDAPAMADRFAFLAGLLGAREHAVADAGDFGWPRLARNWMRMRGGFAMRLVPFGRHRDQLAVRVALGDVGQHDRGRAAGVVQLLAPPLDLAFVGRLAQHLLRARRGRRSSGRRRARSRARRPCPCACR